MPPPLRPLNFLAVLLAGALSLSLIINGILLRYCSAPIDRYDSLLETEADLRLTQRLLARCQAAHQQQDSLLALRPQRPPTIVPTKAQ